jgi:hypothetical protein
MNEDQNINAEKSELNLLIDKGVNFDIERTFEVRQNGFFGRFKKRYTKTETLKFTIKEPTLAVLDLISSEQIELRIDEAVMSSESGVQEAKKMTGKHGETLARIVAFAVLGQDYIKTKKNGSGFIYKYDDKRLDELTELFFIHIKPSKLLQLAILVNTMSNLGDFTNSIRLMSASRTTMPIRVEENNVD